MMVDQFRARRHGTSSSAAFPRGQLALDNLLDAARSKLYRHSDVESFPAIFPFEYPRQGSIFVLSFKCLHISTTSAMRVIRQPGLHKLTISAPPFRVRLTIAAMRLRGSSPAEAAPPSSIRAAAHVIAMSSEDNNALFQPETHAQLRRHRTCVIRAKSSTPAIPITGFSRSRSPWTHLHHGIQ